MPRRQPLELRLTAPATGDALPIIILSHGFGRSYYISSKDGYAPLAYSGPRMGSPSSSRCTPAHSTVGFDRFFDFLDNILRDAGDGYRPFDIERLDEESYRITLAVVGFRPDEIEIVAQQNQLTVSGRKAEETEPGDRYLHRGMAARSFERRFQLADFIKVRDAGFGNGLLSIALGREVPEAMKPRKIEIGNGSGQR